MEFTNHFKPAFQLLKREKQDGKTKRIYEPTPQTPYQRLLASPGTPGASTGVTRLDALARSGLFVGERFQRSVFFQRDEKASGKERRAARRRNLFRQHFWARV